MLAERPMLVEQRHAGRGICIQHLLGSDDLDLVRVDIEPSSDQAISSQASWIRCNFEKSQSAPSNRYPAVAVMARLSPACDGAETGRETTAHAIRTHRRASAARETGGRQAC